MNNRPNIPLMQLAAGLLQPSRTFGGALGNGVAGLSKGLMYEDQHRLAERSDNRQQDLTDLRKSLFQHKLLQAAKAEEAQKQLAEQRKGYMPGVMQEMPQQIDPLSGVIRAAETRDMVRDGYPVTQPQVEHAFSERMKQNARETGLMMPDGSHPDAGLGVLPQDQSMNRMQQLQAAYDAAMGNNDLTYAEAYQKQMEMHKAQNLAPDSKAINPMTGATIAENKKPADMNKMLIPDGKGGYKVNQLYLAGKKAIAEAGATRLSNIGNTKGETKYDETINKHYADADIGFAQAANQAPRDIANYEQMGTLLAGLEGGKLEGGKTALFSAANSLGIRLDPRLGDKEAAEALSREIAAGMRQTGTGPMTDKDFENFLKRVPDLTKSAAGRKIIIDTAIANAKRNQEVAAMAEAYKEKNGGRIDGRFMNQVSEFYRANPVVSGTLEPEMRGPDPATASDEEILRHLLSQ